MTNVLFTSAREIKQITGIGGNIDPDKIRPHIITAQDIHLQKLMGTQLYDELIHRVNTSTLTGHYLTLVNDEVKRFVAFKAAASYIRVGGYNIANEGITRHQPDNAIPVDRFEVSNLAELFDNNADYYGGRLYEYLCTNQTLFPEFNEIQSGDVKRDNQTYFSGIHF